MGRAKLRAVWLRDGIGDQCWGGGGVHGRDLSCLSVCIVMYVSVIGQCPSKPSFYFSHDVFHFLSTLVK